MNSENCELERARLALVRADLLQESAYIDGAWVCDAPDGVIWVRNPATRRPLGHVPNCGERQARLAVAAAHRAFAGWRALSAKQRSVVLHRWFELINVHAEDLARLLTAEQGKPLSEAHAEIAYGASYLEWFSEEAKRVYGETIPGHQENKRLTVLREPIGVVAAITPWNFPSAMIMRKVAPALAVGCTVVLKPSELTPFSALALARLAEEAGVPNGVFNVVTGSPEPIGHILTDDPRVSKFTFTGSTRVGKLLAARCMATVKRVSLELGGNAPFLVFEDADIDRAVEGAIAAKFRNAGQTCVCANRFLVHAAVHDEFTRKLVQRVESFVIGDGLERDTQQGPLISAAAVSKSHEYVVDALDRGAQLVTGGGARDSVGNFYAPTVLTGITAEMKLFREEIFGPVAAITQFTDEAHAVRLANDTRAGLASYVYTRDIDRAVRVSEMLEYGMVGLNTGLISTAIAPFGGVKESGLGREGSHIGLDDYLNIKLICAEIS